VSGTGPHGRIVARDVEGAKVMASAAPAPVAAASVVPVAAPPPPAAPRPPAPAGAPQGATVEQVKALFAPDSYKEMPLDGMRKTIAKRLLESKQTIPHFYLTLDTDLDALIRVRETLNGAAPKGGDGKPAYKLSVNDFVIKALALALQRVPDANACWAEDRILKFNHSDVGVAVAIPGGLFTPVIRKAEQKSLSTISSEMKDYATRARARKLQPHEYQGGSTAVSNLGMFGIREFAAVINPPHASILAVGGGEARAVVRKGEIVAVQQMTVTLSCDHRVVDGALGAELLQSFRSYIENPMSMLV
jgi:pyruvate dehydrogenase E2 component (dihydrolipoamide acetyltransferase)